MEGVGEMFSGEGKDSGNGKNNKKKLEVILHIRARVPFRSLSSVGRDLEKSQNVFP